MFLIAVRPRLSELCLALGELTWGEVKSLAVHLDVDYNELRKIEEETLQITTRTVITMNVWLESDQNASWKKVISGLRYCKKNVLAMELERKYCTAGPSLDTSSGKLF